LYRQLLNNLRFYQGFEINNFTGEALTENDMSEQHYAKLKKLQQVAFKEFQPELRRFALSSVGKFKKKKSRWEPSSLPLPFPLPSLPSLFLPSLLPLPSLLSSLFLQLCS
jgi:hypothetical protein